MGRAAPVFITVIFSCCERNVKKAVKLCGRRLQTVYRTVAWHIVSAIVKADLLALLTA